MGDKRFLLKELSRYDTGLYADIIYRNALLLVRRFLLEFLKKRLPPFMSRLFKPIPSSPFALAVQTGPFRCIIAVDALP